MWPVFLHTSYFWDTRFCYRIPSLTAPVHDSRTRCARENGFPCRDSDARSMVYQTHETMTDYQVSEGYWSRQYGCVHHVLVIPTLDDASDDDDPYAHCTVPQSPPPQSCSTEWILTTLVQMLLAIANTMPFRVWYQLKGSRVAHGDDSVCVSRAHRA